jgi:hypothetical protein
MPFVKNVSSQGDLELPILGRIVSAGETVEVTSAQFDQLKDQPDVWATVKESKE